MFLDGTATKWILTFVYFAFFVVVKQEPRMNTEQSQFCIRVDPRPSVVINCTFKMLSLGRRFFRTAKYAKHHCKVI